MLIPGGFSFTVALADEEATRRLMVDIAAALSNGAGKLRRNQFSPDNTCIVRDRKRSAGQVALHFVTTFLREERMLSLRLNTFRGSPRRPSRQHRSHVIASGRDRSQVAPGSHAALVLDGAGYHVAKDLAVPHNITLVPLPPYAPELNPIENVWEYLRGNKLAITVFDSYDDILDKACDAWTFFANDQNRIASITTRSWATVIL